VLVPLIDESMVSIRIHFPLHQIHIMYSATGVKDNNVERDIHHASRIVLFLREFVKQIMQHIPNLDLSIP